MAELAFIDWLRQHVRIDPRVVVGMGDDAAAVKFRSDQPVLITTDMLLEGSCFILAEAGPRLVGRKAMAVNLSDVAAMAGKPVAAVVSVGLPRSAPQAVAEELFLGMQELARAFDTLIVGGDTNSWDGPLVINVTLLGEPTGAGPVCRHGAEPGDWLFVTGPLGGSLAGHHLTFTPRVREAMLLHEHYRLKAMIDLSDGLGLDLHRLCQESACGARLRAAAIPLAEAARTPPDARSSLEHALGDGEDFELLFAAAPGTGKQLLAEQPLLKPFGATLHHIGECQAQGMEIVGADGTILPLKPSGYEHAFGG